MAPKDVSIMLAYGANAMLGFVRAKPVGSLSDSMSSSREWRKSCFGHVGIKHSKMITGSEHLPQSTVVPPLGVCETSRTYPVATDLDSLSL